MTRRSDAAVDAPAAAPPLVVELDCTLLCSGLLWEALALFARTRAGSLWRLPLWLRHGKAGLARRLARSVCPDPALLPYDAQVLALMARARADGRQVVLASAAPRRWAAAVAGHLRGADLLLADGADPTGARRAATLRQRYGDAGYDYVGDARADIAAWRGARRAYAVTTAPFQLGAGRQTEALGSRTAVAPALLRALRPRQWLKNLLVLVPLLAAHALSGALALRTLGAFAAFCLCASSAYLINDALDAGHDRRHPLKRQRPIAAGTLPLAPALAAAPLLAAAGLLLAAAGGPALNATVALYLVATLAYSLWLKRLLMLDTVALALLYLLRILGGGAATGIAPSFWLLAFSFFLFLSLALLKRYSELANLRARGKLRSHGRGYLTADQAVIGMMGVSGALLSVLIFMLYINSSQVRALYPRPDWLMGVVPLLVLWLGRLWLLAGRGAIDEDPLLYVSRDKASLTVAALCLGLSLAAAR